MMETSLNAYKNIALDLVTPTNKALNSELEKGESNYNIMIINKCSCQDPRNLRGLWYYNSCVNGPLTICN